MLATNFDGLKVDQPVLFNPKLSADAGIKVAAVAGGPTGLKDNLRNLFLNLTESSSSGSITDSVCTAYEQTVEVEEHKPVMQDIETVVSADKKPGNLFDGILKTFSNKMDGIKIKSVDPFNFSTTTFHQMDHRLQIYVYQNVFLESNEKFICVIRCRFFDDFMKLTRSAEDSIIVMSNKKIYVFLVVGEEHDDPQQWLRLITRVDLAELTTVGVLPFDIGLRFSFFSKSTIGDWNLITKDQSHTQNFLAFFRKKFKGEIEDCASQQHQEKLAKANENEEILHFSAFKTFRKLVNETATAVEYGFLLVTKVKFYVLSADLKWLVDKRSDKPEIRFSLLLKDMVELEAKTDTEFVLNFLDEYEKQYEQWYIEFETKAGTEAVLNAIREPWEQIFDVPLIQK